jgi:hypothetical protein
VANFSPGAHHLRYRDMDYVISKRGAYYEWTILPQGESNGRPVAAGTKFRGAVEAARAAIDDWLAAHPAESVG